jgi:Flp pilus assembly protein TadG
LVIETSRMMARSEEIQTAADSAALVAAEMLNRGATNTTARTTTINFASTYNGVTPGSVQLDLPPSTGPYANQSSYAEVKMISGFETPLARLVQGSSTALLHARAVAGPKTAPWPDLLLTLDNQSVPGLQASGPGQLRVEGTCTVNSRGGGVDETGLPVTGLAGYGAQVSQLGLLIASQVRVTGGVNDPTRFEGLTPNSTAPLLCRAGWTPDPFKDLPAPRAALGVNIIDRGRIRSTSSLSTSTARPGLYSEILVSAGTVTFQPGFYVIRGGSLTLTGGTISGQGVLFYLTGSDYSALYGTPDNGDGENTPSTTTTMGGVTISTQVNLTGYGDSASPFYGMLIHTRRFNTNPIVLSSPQTAGTLSGTVYSKWGPLTLSGSGIYNLQGVVRRAVWNGSGTLTLTPGNATFVKNSRVYLLE